MAKRSDQKNKGFFYISLFDMFVEISYKIMTNVKMLMESGFQMTERIVTLLLTLMPYAINRCNSYWNQYFKPADKNSKIFRLRQYIDPYFYWFFMMLVAFVVCSKMLVDYRHIQATVIVYIMSKVAVGFYLSWFFYIFIISALLESFIASMSDWYTNYTGKKVAEYYNVGLKTKPIKVKLMELIKHVKLALNCLNNVLEAFYNVLLLYFDSSLLYAILFGSMTVVASFYSSYIKTQVTNKQNVSCKVQHEKSSLLFEIVTLFLFVVMVITPIVQIHVIMFNVSSFLSLPINSFWSIFTSSLICFTFIVHKFIQKGDQVFKYLYGLDYTDGYSMLGGHIDMTHSQELVKRQESSTMLTNLESNVFNKEGQVGDNTRDEDNHDDVAFPETDQMTPKKSR